MRISASSVIKAGTDGTGIDTGNVTTDVVKIPSVLDLGNSGAAKEIDFSVAQSQKLTLTDNCVISFADVSLSGVGAGNFTLELVQDVVGGRTVTFSSVRASGGALPTFSTSPNAIDLIVFSYNGVKWTVAVGVSDVQDVP